MNSSKRTTDELVSVQCVKKRQKADEETTNYDYCILCQASPKGLRLYKVQPTTAEKLKNAIAIRKDATASGCHRMFPNGMKNAGIVT